MGEETILGAGGRGLGADPVEFRMWGPSSRTTAGWRGFFPPEIFLGKEQAELGFILLSMPSGWFFSFQSFLLLHLFIHSFFC